ncbi:MAG TPA: serine/threonine-protein kinase, partial [Gemmataceae bacterium]|nr:serine/threonine-protein kinase [Gemmataceae bacterium]
MFAKTGPLSAGRYRELRFHNRGGLGEVYVAHDVALHRDVALKRIRRERATDPESRRRFLIEAEITGQLEHPGIVPVHDLTCDEEGQPCYAMRFVQGESLKDAIKHFHDLNKPVHDPGERTLALRQLLNRLIAVCNAVEYAHSRGVLHRDIKPANIMAGAYGETLLLDWGLAKAGNSTSQQEFGRDSAGEPLLPSAAEQTLLAVPARAPANTQTGHAMGTPAYMSPEQAAGRWREVGPLSDVYSLGATLYYLLAGKAPFQEKDFKQFLSQVERGEFPRPREIKPTVPPALEAICLKAMAPRPQDRYGSATALSGDLEHWLADEPVSAFPESTLARLGRWGRRHRPLMVGTLVLLATT